jgi:MYXO-CTERM domain-containing protein
LVNIQGAIISNGSNGANHGNDAAGGGAGGGILIEAGILNCTGTLQAQGGNGAIVDDAGGGGGGGVLKQFYDSLSSLCSMDVSGGTTSRGATAGAVGINSSAQFDYDGDGFTSTDGDCDVSDATVYPGGIEFCDGIDNDCDGTVDESDAVDATTWYEDGDGDGYGLSGHGEVNACATPGSGYATVGEDCDDSDPAVHPAASEVCDSIDNDCDGDIDDADSSIDTTTQSTWYEDGDGDGYGLTGHGELSTCDTPASGYASSGGDCDDSVATTFPGAPEICDGVDNDCDGTTDESGTNATTWYADSDSDGYGDSSSSTVSCAQPSAHVADSADCDDSSAAVNPAALETCNGIDDDCDGIIDEDDATDATTWYADTDGDGYGNVNAVLVSCSQPSSHVADLTDCDDNSATVNPSISESCNGIDDDCDGTIDEDDATDAPTWYVDADSDGYGDDFSTTQSCQQPTGTVAQGGDCNDNDPASYPGASETWYDGVDADCDGASDFDADGDGYDSDGYGGNDCDDDDASIHPEAVDAWYDGVDANCDGASDFDADGDGYDSASYGGDDCDDSRSDTWPGAPDTPHDGVINDCNLTSDNDADGDGFDGIDFGGTDCDDANSSIHPEAEEIWYDGVDDNCDGNDSDQDEDGFSLDEDCDDTDPDAYPGAPGWSEDCEPVDTGVPLDTGTDTALFDTGTGSFQLKGGSGCACSSAPTRLNLLPAGLFLGLALLRRREPTRTDQVQ